MQIRPYYMFHGHQSFRRASSSSSICQLVNLVDEIDEKNIFLKLYFFPLDNVAGRIECKLDPISCFIAISQSEELRQVRQHVNKVDEIEEQKYFFKNFISFL